ncbi:protein TASOR 2 isoform X1 [Corvus moneduloides]|nr:protein TASOR 2 isoform X1 [Corvus moneduloides]
MGERRRRESSEPGTGFPAESEEPSSLLQRAVAVLQSSYLDSTSQDGFQYSQAILVENDLFLSELKAFARAKEAAGYSPEELQETFAFLLFDKEEEAREVCQSGLRVNSSSISTLGDPAKGVYVSKHADCLRPRPWHHGKSGFIVICKLIRGKVRAIAENSAAASTCPSPGYDCHVSKHGPTKSSPCQAFEQSQYYVYEVSGSSAAERPRQVCPYIFLACQYREPEAMPVLAVQNLAERNHKALYCPWRGQLSVRGQLLCTIALRTPYGSTIPAQLPPSLDINHVMGLADLRKKLPAAAFGKKNYTGNEVCFQGVYSSLYEVEISNKDQQKMDQLVENLKEKDLAIIKYLREQGVLILLTASALARDHGLEPKEPVSLLALFLFTSPRALGPTVENQDAKESRDRSDISLKITSVLPGLRYALRKAASSSWNSSSSTSTWIKEQLQEYAKLQENSQPSPSQNSDVPVPSVLSPSEDEAAHPSQKLSERSLAQLQRYLSDPSSFTLGMSAALECLSGAGSNLGADPGNSSSAVPSPDPAPPNGRDESEAPNPTLELEQGGEGFPKNVNSPSKLWGQQNRRKSSRILGKNLSPLKAHPVEDDSRNREAAKKKINTALSFPKKSGSNPNEPMLKLANLQFPHGRKRGAEVLAAEIIHKPQCDLAEKESSAPGAPGVEAKRPKTLENPDTRKVPVAENGAKPGKSKTPKSLENRASKPAGDDEQAEREQNEPLSHPPSEASSQSHEAECHGNEVYPTGIPSVAFAPQGDNCESHALNLLADLALGSCIPPFIPKDCGIIPVSCSLPGDSTEQQSPSKPKSPRMAPDHKYHRAEKHGRKATSTSKVSMNEPLPEKTHPNHPASLPKEKTFGIFSRTSVNLIPAKLQALPSREAPEAAEVNQHSIISAEHSYASPMPEHPRKHPNPKGNPSAGPAPSKNGPRNAPAAPLVGKVLPFRHQQSSALEPSRSRSSPRKKEDFSKSHTVNICGDSMRVTCRWEEEYLFHLDSRYTNDSLEKTVIRALHGPWDPDLPDDVEGMKLILHMWVALFYRKPSKLLSSSRKVVEHCNPTKFVSISSSGGFLELSDDSQDCFAFETCPADSGSDPDQTPSSSLDPSTPSCQGLPQPEKSPADSQTDADGIPGAVDSTVSSSSGELPCGEEEEPSSTSCPESLSLRDDAGERRDVGRGEPEVVPEEDARDVSSVGAEEPVKENLLDSRITPSPSQELGCSGKSPAEFSNPGSQTPNSSSAPWTDPPCVLQENGEQQENQWEAGSGSGPGPPEDGEGMGDSGHPLEVEDGSWAAGTDPQPPCDSVPLEANPASAEPGGATEEGVESQEPSEHLGKEQREVEEGKEEEFEDESSFLGPVDLMLSESSDAEMECEHREQNPGNSASPEELGVPEEDPVPSPTSLASPCPDRSTPALSDGTGTDPEGFPEEMSPSRDELPDPWDAPGSADSEIDGLGAASPAEVGSPHSDSGEPLSPPDPSPVHEAQPDSVTGNPGAAGDALGNGSEQKNWDHAPSAERWEPARSTASLESPRSQGMTLTLSPDSSSVCLTSPDGSVDPWAAPEDPPMESLQSPSQSELGRSSCCSQACGDDADPELDSLDTEESNQGGSRILVEEQHGSAAASGTEELDDPMGAGDGRDSPLDYADTGDDSRAEEREDEFPEAENSPGNDTMSMEMAADTPQEPGIPLHHHLLESEPPSSSIREGISAIKELPRQQQNFPNIHGEPAPASPPHTGGSNPPIPAVPSRRESVLCRLWKPCWEGGAAQVSVAAWSLDGSLNPSCSQEEMRAPHSPADEFVPAEPGSAPPSPCDPWDDPEGAEPGSPLPEALPGMLPPSPDSARWSGSCGSAGSQAGDAGGSPGEEPIPPEDLEGGSIPSPAPFPARECPLCEPWAGCEHSPEGSEAFPDPDCAGSEVGEGEIPDSPMPASPLGEHRDPSGESPELSDAEDISDELPREEQLQCQDGHEGSAFEDPLENSFGDSEQEYFEGNSRSPLPTRNSCIMSSSDAAGTRTSWDNSPRSSVHMEEHGEDWDRGIPRDYGSFMVTRQCQERMENFQLPKRRSRRARESPLLRSLMGTWRGFEEITQNTLDMECLRFHYKLKQILRNGKPPFSTSKSIFPKDFCAPIPLSPRSRSPLQVTIPPSDAWLGGLHSCRHRDNRDTRRARSRARSRDRRAPLHLGKLRYDRALPDSRGDVAVILDEYSEFQRVVLSRAEARSEGPAQGEAGNARVGMSRPGRTVAFGAVIAELRGALRAHLRRVADGQPGMFYLLETGQEPFFDRVKALLKDEGFVRTEPLNFCGAAGRDGERLLVIVRNEDISSHIHSVPCLLQLKRCPGVVFAGVDDPEDVTGDTFQELFQAGGFVVSDEELLERVTLGQLKEVVKVLEKLNRNGRWKWLLHHKESKKLRGDLSRGDAQKKQLLLKWCQGAELVELLHFHGCDSPAAPESRHIQCLLELQVRHIHARFAVYLTENPSGSSSREILESKGILVADINTFLGTVQKVAAPFRRSYW